MQILEIEIGLKHLISLEAQRKYIEIINSKLKTYRNLKEIFFCIQNEDVIVREYSQIPKIKKKDLEGYINFEIIRDMPVNIKHYIIKSKILYSEKKFMDIQIILFPRYIEKICAKISDGLKIKHKYLNINFDIIQKLIDKNKVDLKFEECIIIENKKNYLILNFMKNKKIYTSNVFEKDENNDYILNFLSKEMHIFFYGEEDEFIKHIKKNGFCVDRLDVNLKIENLLKDKIVNKNGEQYLISVGVMV